MKPDEPAFPAIVNMLNEPGITKREYFAALALQGLCVCAIPGAHNSPNRLVQEHPTTAVMLADALIKALNETSK
jgi:hypothetical protein